MSWLQSVLHGIARAFTIPKATRDQLNANPLAPVVKASLALELNTLIQSTVDNHVTDPVQAAVVKTALVNGINATGVLK